LNIPKIIYEFECALYAWRNASNREHTYARWIQDNVTKNAGVYPSLDEHNFEIGIATLKARIAFYKALGINVPQIVFDPEKDESQYNMYSEGAA
jgi:hypothetical protein